MLIDPEKFKTDLLSRSEGVFIVFEGGNGVGKSTLMNKIAQRLHGQGQAVVITREPGGTELGGAIRTLVKERKDIRIDETAELLLFCADRAQHIQEIIKPALAEKKWVLCDRHYFSTLAFQGYGRGVSFERIDAAVKLATNGMMPNLTVIVDLPIAEAKKRMTARQVGASVIEIDKFEDEANTFQEKVRQGFLELARTRREPCLILDGTKSPEALVGELCAVIIP